MQRLINLGLLLAFPVCYLEWGRGHHAFVGQVEYDLLLGNIGGESFRHPAVLIPFLGQLMLLYSVLRPDSRRLALSGLLMQGTLVLLILTGGILSANARIIASVMPYMFMSVLFFVKGKKKTPRA